MRTAIYSIIALALCIATSISLSAQQEKDSVWYVELYRYSGPYMGEEYNQSYVKIWLDGERTLMRLANDRYVSMFGDSVHILDTFHTSYVTGPVALRELLWADEQQIRHRKTVPPLSIIRTGKKQIVDGYDAEEWNVLMAMNRRFMPIRQEMLVTTQLPLPDSLISNFYLVQSFVEGPIFTDWLGLADTLMKERRIPLITRWHTEIPSDSMKWFTTELVDIGMRTVPKDFFLPPANYTFKESDMPKNPDDYFWMLRMIPMPGGPRE